MCQHKAPHREWSPNLKNLDWSGDRSLPSETLFDDYSGRGMAEHGQDRPSQKPLPTRREVPFPARMTEAQLKVWNAYYEPRNEEFRKINPQGKDLTRWRYQRYMHDYLGTVASVDESVGRLLKYLDDEGLAENTIVVYSSDQGFYLGEHGWFDKRWYF
jgi:arylsulfatase A-like enzyme